MWGTSRSTEVDCVPPFPDCSGGPTSLPYVRIQSSFQGPSRHRQTRRSVQYSFSRFGSGTLRRPASSAGGGSYASVFRPSTSFFGARRRRVLLAGASSGCVSLLRVPRFRNFRNRLQRRSDFYFVAARTATDLLLFPWFQLCNTELGPGLSLRRCPEAASRRKGALSTPRGPDCQRSFLPSPDKQESP